MYLVTVEDNDDGTWWDEPNGFDSRYAADEYIKKLKPPSGYSIVLYSCHEMRTISAVTTEQR